MKTTLKERMAYSRDNFMARGSGSIFMALLVIFLAGFAIIALGRIVVDLLIPGGTAEGTENWWTTFLALTDPGNMNQDNFSSWYIKVFTVLSGMFGIVFFSAVIAFITTQLDQKLDELKKGRSRVIESDHILILGWNDRIVEILNELIIANESEKDGAVVILADQPKEEMDDFLNEQIPQRITTRFITRTGEISSHQALERVAVQEAKSVILLPMASSNSSDEMKASSDAHSLKTLLAIAAACKGEENIPDTVLEIFQDSNRSIIEDIFSSKVTLVSPEEMIAKITVQTSRTTGLGSVYTDLFGFDGCEFYFTKPDCSECSFGELAYHYPDGVPIGIRTGEGEIVLKPEFDRRLGIEDELIMIAEDDSTIDYKKKILVTPKEIPFRSQQQGSSPEKILIIGWNSKGHTILEQFLDYIMDGSEILIAVEQLQDDMSELANSLKSSEIDIQFKEINPLLRGELQALNLDQFQSIVVLNTIHHNQEVADAKSINILLLLRTLLGEAIRTGKTQIISEVMNAENLELISHAGVNDTIISTKMISKILAQIAEEPDVQTIYDELFKEEGSEIYLKPLSYYTEEEQLECRFADLLHLAQKRDEIAIGFRDMSLQYSVEESFGIAINPAKDEMLNLTAQDCIIVLAEDEN